MPRRSAIESRTVRGPWVSRSPRRPGPHARRSRKTRRRRATRWHTAHGGSARRSRRLPRRPRRASGASPTSRSRRTEPDEVWPMRAPAGLHLDYVSLAEYQAAEWGDVLGVATFSGTRDRVGATVAEIPVAQVSTPVLPGTGHVFEAWRCNRQFNSARQHALRASGRSLAGNVPAASALGAARNSPLVVYFLAGRSAPCFVENPRQLSAYHYPRQYGVHSPVFSRATLWRAPDGLALFISGTASIVGHRSLHVGDTAAQTRETLTNIEALLAEAHRAARGARFRLGALALKVYVRRPADLPVIEAELAAALGESARVIYLQADICRQDLLVEIEATGMCPLDAAA